MSDDLSNVEEMIARIPQFAPHERISKVIRKIARFFSTPHDINNPLMQRILLFPISNNYIFEVQEHEKMEINQMIKSQDASIFNYLENQPHVCSYIAESSLFNELIKMYRPKYYNELCSIALYSDSFEILKYALLEAVQPTFRGLAKPKPISAIQWFTGPDFYPNLYINESRKICSTPTPLKRIYQLCSTTSFAVNDSAVFIGTSDGTIIIHPIPSNPNAFPPYYAHYHSILNIQYSLAWSRDNLYIITESQLYLVDLTAGKLSAQFGKPRTLVPPLCCDGRNIYCYNNRFKTVHIHEPTSNNFQIVRKIKLERGFDGDLPFVSDGSLITFIEVDPIHTSFHIFSLVTGQLISALTSETNFNIMAWCISPYTLEHYVLTDHEILSVNGDLQIPRWVIGLTYPKSQEVVSLMDSLQYMMFSGGTFFQDANLDLVASMMEEYIKAKNIDGFKLATYIFMWAHDTNIRPCLELIECCFNTYNKDVELRKFCCVSYLHRLEMVLHEPLKLPNMVSTFIETEFPPDVIWMYPHLFDFIKIELSNDAIMKVISYVSIVSSYHPTESIFIIRSFLQYAFTLLNTVDIDVFSGPFSAIQIGIQQQIIDVSRKNSVPPFFYATQCQIWMDSLKYLYEAKPIWPRIAHIFSKLLEFGMWDRTQFLGNNQTFQDLLDYTLYLLTGLIFSTPYFHQDFNIKSLDILYERFDHPINHLYESIDEKCLNIISNSYDIDSETEFYQRFSELRNYMIFENPDSESYYDELMEQSPFLFSGVIDFFETKSTLNLVPIRDPMIIAWFIHLFESNHLELDQEIILSSYLPQISNRVNDILKCDHRTKCLNSFIRCFSFPFMLPPEIILKSDISFNASEIIQFPLGLIHDYFDNFSKSFAVIEDGTQLLIPFIIRYPDENAHFTDFVKEEYEPYMYSRALLWLLAFKSDEIIDLRGYIILAFRYIKTGTPRLIEAIMQSFQIAELAQTCPVQSFHQKVLDLVGDYLFTLDNPFINVTDHFEILECIFVIINHYRQILAIGSSSILQFLETYISNEDPKRVLVVFAMLNDSIDTLNQKVEVHIDDTTGKLQEFDSKSNTIKVDNMKFNDFTRFWLQPVKLDYSKFNSQMFAHLFMTVKYTEHYQNVYYYASLAEFIKIEEFTSLLSNEFKESLISTKLLPNAFSGKDLYDFLYYSPLVSTGECFMLQESTEMDTSSLKCSSVTQNFKKVNMKESYSAKGTLISTFEKIVFKSTPIHPRSRTKINFENFSEESDIQISVYAVCSKCTLVYRSNIKKEIIFDNKSNKFIIDGQKTVVWPPSVEIIYLNIELQPSMYVDYQCIIDDKFNSLENFTEEHEKMEVTQDIGFTPNNDSFIFNKFSLEKASRNLINTFMHIIVTSIIGKTKSPSLIFQILSFIHPFALDTQTNLLKLKLRRNFWHHNEKLLYDFICNSINIIEFQCFIDEFNNNQKNKGRVYVDNTSALFFSNNLKVSFSFQLTNDDIKFIDDPAELSDGIIVPYNDFACSKVDLILYSHQLLIIANYKGVYDIQPLRELLCNLHISLLDPIKKQLDILYPKDINHKSFLFNNSHYTNEQISLISKNKYDNQQIRDELKKWKTVQTVQIQYSDLNEESFKLLPLSTEFSVSTTNFVKEIIDDNISIFTRKNYQYSFWQNLFDPSIENTNRLKQLKEFNINCLISQDAYTYYMQTSYHNSMDLMNVLHESTSIVFNILKCEKQIGEWITSFIIRAQPIVVLQFIDYCTGKSWLDRKNQRIKVITIKKKDLIQADQNEYLLFVGKFLDETMFVNCLLIEIEKYLNKLYG